MYYFLIRRRGVEVLFINVNTFFDIIIKTPPLTTAQLKSYYLTEILNSSSPVRLKP